MIARLIFERLYLYIAAVVVSSVFVGGCGSGANGVLHSDGGAQTDGAAGDADVPIIDSVLPREIADRGGREPEADSVAPTETLSDAEEIDGLCVPTPQASVACHDGDIWWQDSCGNWESLSQQCLCPCGVGDLVCPDCPDADGDGHFDAAAGGDDCDDSDPNVHPGATELCDFKDNDCSAGGSDPACGVYVKRYHDCTSHHWSSTLEDVGPYCAPYPDLPAAGCAANSCPLTTCDDTSCWTAESGPGTGFNVFTKQEGQLTQLLTLYHCHLPDTAKNKYSVAPCVDEEWGEGVPPTLGLIAPSEIGPPGLETSPLYQCNWLPGLGGDDYFLTTELGECTAVDGTSEVLGYVWP